MVGSRVDGTGQSQCRDVLFIWFRVGQVSRVLAVGAGGLCLDALSLSLSLSETTV